MPTKHFISHFGILFLFLIACTPKVSETTNGYEAESVPVDQVADENLSDCPHWTGAPFKEKAETLHVLYKDRLRENDYEEAFRLWKQVYEIAPAADGKRPDHYLDGIKIYHQQFQTASNQEQKEDIIDQIMKLYEEASACYPKNASIYTGLKAFDLYYKYPDRASDMEKYTLFKKSIDAEGKEAHDFVINPFTSLLVQLFMEEKISISEAQKYAALIPQIIQTGMKKAKTSIAKERWSLVEGYAPIRLEELEGVKGFYECSYYKEKYLPEYRANPDDCEIIATTYGRLKWGDCPESDPALQMLQPKIATCFPPAPIKEPVVLCSNFLREGDYNQAVNCYEEKAGETNDVEKQAQYLFVMAKIYYAHLKRFDQARKYALRAADVKPGWGEPYILIGKLYASSGPLCGPGRGWDSQIVTWPAIDMWNKAKNVDPSVAGEANKLIDRYAQYMPSMEDIFQRNLKVGDSFRIPCWIQETTTIRAAKNQ